MGQVKFGLINVVQNIFKIKISIESILNADGHDDSSRTLLYKEITITNIEEVLIELRNILIGALENPFRFIKEN